MLVMASFTGVVSGRSPFHPEVPRAGFLEDEGPSAPLAHLSQAALRVPTITQDRRRAVIWSAEAQRSR